MMHRDTKQIGKHCISTSTLQVTVNNASLLVSVSGVFLIPYIIIMIVCGVPMLYMELAVGQYTGRGPIGALGHLCPLLKGKRNVILKTTRQLTFSFFRDRFR